MTYQTNTRKHRHNGFTLIELLVVMSTTAILIGLLLLGCTKGPGGVFAAVRAAGATVVADLLSLPASSMDRDSLTSQFAAAANSGMSVNHAFHALKGADGKVSFQSARAGLLVVMGDGSVRSIRTSIVDPMWRAMELGVYNEKVDTLPAVALTHIPSVRGAHATRSLGPGGGRVR